jgi:hypothetical protein
MTQEEGDQQNEYEDGGMGGPGAPTPLSALEVRIELLWSPRTDHI